MKHSNVIIQKVILNGERQIALERQLWWLKLFQAVSAVFVNQNQRQQLRQHQPQLYVHISAVNDIHQVATTRNHQIIMILDMLYLVWLDLRGIRWVLVLVSLNSFLDNSFHRWKTLKVWFKRGNSNFFLFAFLKMLLMILSAKFCKFVILVDNFELFYHP